jgi:hypothetical protein
LAAAGPARRRTGDKAAKNFFRCNYTATIFAIFAGALSIYSSSAEGNTSSESVF